MARKSIITILLFFILEQSFAQDFSLYQKKVFIANGDTIPYRLLLPENYDPSQLYPVIFFLHGSGERGNNNQSQLIHGGFLFLVDSIRKNYPAIVVFPQCSANGTWANASNIRDSSGKFQRIFQTKGESTKDMVLLQKLVKNVLHNYSVNNKQVYVGGLSLGGMGTFEIVRRNPRLFAAAFPICGGANVEIAPKLKHVNWWVFHGADDNSVAPKFSADMVTAMRAIGIPTQFTLYPKTGHNSWDKVFVEPTLFSWLFSNIKR